MDHLIALALLGKPNHHQFSNADAEARYYAAMDPGNRRWIALPIASIMVVVAVVLVGVLPW
jgi:uncharacterized protein (DUF2236 family)